MYGKSEIRNLIYNIPDNLMLNMSNEHSRRNPKPREFNEVPRKNGKLGEGNPIDYKENLTPYIGCLQMPNRKNVNGELCYGKTNTRMVQYYLICIFIVTFTLLFVSISRVIRQQKSRREL